MTGNSLSQRNSIAKPLQSGVYSAQADAQREQLGGQADLSLHCILRSAAKSKSKPCRLQLPRIPHIAQRTRDIWGTESFSMSEKKVEIDMWATSHQFDKGRSF
jgi:hypothetical protein